MRADRSAAPPVASGPEPEALTDGALVGRVRAGDAAAFDALLRRHGRQAFAVAHRLLRHREDAEDAVQDAFIAALEGLAGYDAGRPFAPWLLRIVANRALNARRSRGVRAAEPLADDDAAARGPSPHRHAERGELALRVAAALDALPERQRDVVRLFELEGLSGAEVAQILDISPATVRWHLHEARKTLRETLAPYGGMET